MINVPAMHGSPCGNRRSCDATRSDLNGGPVVIWHQVAVLLIVRKGCDRRTRLGVSAQACVKFSDDQFGGGFDGVVRWGFGDERIDVATKLGIVEFSPQVRFGFRRGEPVGAIRGERGDDVVRWDAKFGEREP